MPEPHEDIVDLPCVKSMWYCSCCTNHRALNSSLSYREPLKELEQGTNHASDHVTISQRTAMLSDIMQVIFQALLIYQAGLSFNTKP